jgi:serine protease inhibitor
MQFNFSNIDLSKEQFCEQEFELLLPKFKLESTYNKHSSVLSDMGLTDMFLGGKADFSGISGNKVCL